MTTMIDEVPATGQDISAIPASDWERRESRGSRRANGCHLVMSGAALTAIHEHGRVDPEVEVCGVLIGNVYSDEQGAYVHVEGCIAGNYAAGKAAQVTFTAETWQHIQQELDDKHPDKRIVGWYHTHPGYGIFLSDMDVFIHENFFNLPWQTAFVFDPKSGEQGLFAWRKGTLAREAFVTEGAGTVNASAAVETATAAPVQEAASVAPGSVLELSKRVAEMEHRQRLTVVALALSFMIALGWPLVATALFPPIEVSTPVKNEAVTGQSLRNLPITNSPESTHKPVAN